MRHRHDQGLKARIETGRALKARHSVQPEKLELMKRRMYEAVVRKLYVE